MDSLERLQGLHADLIAHSQKSLYTLERLSQELQDSIADFRSLLDKVQVTPDESKDFRNGKIEFEGRAYEIKPEFQQISTALGTTLEIAEEHAGRLIIEVQSGGVNGEQETINSAVSLYHDRRDLVLQDLRLLLKQSLEIDLDVDIKRFYNDVVQDVVNPASNHPSHGPSHKNTFAQRCIDAMIMIEERQSRLNEQIQSKAILSQARGEAFYQTLEFQRSSLFKQHEALGAILALLFTANHTAQEDLRRLHTISRKWQRLDFHWVHYLPAFAAAFERYGSPDGNGSGPEALQLNHLLAPTVKDGKLSDDPNGPYRPLAATLELWWTAEYSGFYRDNAAQDKDAAVRDKIMKRALDDGGLEFMLSICTSIRHDPWGQSSARQELVDMLLEGSNISFDGIEPTSPYFVTMLMEAFEAFAEAWITNMPDSIRDLKKEEDDRRLQQITAGADGLLQRSPRDQGVRLHLEAFLVAIAFAFEGRPDAAEQFWDDPDSNLYGFIQWASRRQTVPRVSAFCEMLIAISSLSTNAQAAHKFLLEDSVIVPTTRNKKFPSMSYQQIFAELDFYSRKVHEKAQTSNLPKQREPSEPEMNETESPIMLSCYLRLVAHLFTQTVAARSFVLGLSDVDLPKSLLALSSGSIPSYLRASIFDFFEALLTDKDSTTSNRLWTTIEEWASTSRDRVGVAPTDKNSTPTNAAVQNTLAAISGSFDQYDAFVKLLIALVRPLPAEGGQPLPFPPDLGANYRYPGIIPYVDFICGQVTSKNAHNWLDEGSIQGYIRMTNAMQFMVACFTGFNEDYVASLDKSSPDDSTNNFYVTYAQRHPFARVMQWIFSSNTGKCLTEFLHRPIESIETTSSTDPKAISLQVSIELYNLVIDLQPTYFDVVKPRLKAVEGYKAIQYSGIAAIEDNIISQPEILLDVCRYAASDHVHLSLAALAFLQKLSESARFQNHLFEDSRRDRSGRRMIEMLGPAGEAKLQYISLDISKHLGLSDRELEAGGDSDEYHMKDGILSFLNACLSSQSDSPNIAHLLLGFERIGDRLGFTSALEQGQSMFDNMTCLATELPVGDNFDLESWLLHLKANAINVLYHLWSFPVSRDLCIVQLRRSNFMVNQLSVQRPVSEATRWDGYSVFQPEFYFRTSAEAFTDFLSYRKHLFDYITKEVQAVSKENVIALQERYLAALQGRSTGDDGIAGNHPSVFDLFDFADLDTRDPDWLAIPPLQIFFDIDFDAYVKDGLCDVGRVRMALESRCEQISRQHDEAKQQFDSEALNYEMTAVIDTLEARNRHVLVKFERMACLRSYVEMVVSIVNCLPMEQNTKTQFILRMLQNTLPKLDTYLSEGTPEALELTRMADTLLFALSSTDLVQGQPRTTEKQIQTRIDVTVSEKLYQLFRICAEGVPLSDTRPDLRAGLYSVCAQYLTRILSPVILTLDSSKKAQSNAMDTVRSAGNQLISIISDDADDGLDTCRLNALNFLSQLVNLARNQSSNLLVESFVKSNILEVLLDPIKNVSQEFLGTDPSNRSHLTTLFEARTHLLLHVSRTRSGATALLDANLIQTLRDSSLFAADPDLGFDLNPADPTALVRSTATPGRSTLTNSSQSKSALTTYFTLLSSLLRLLLSTFLSFGPENEKMVYIIRTFLAEYRGNMVGIFKRAAGLNLAMQQQVEQDNVSFLGGRSVLNAQDREMRKYVDECVNAYTGLAVGCGFMDFEDERGLGGNGIVSSSVGMGRNGAGFT